MIDYIENMTPLSSPKMSSHNTSNEIVDTYNYKGIYGDKSSNGGSSKSASYFRVGKVSSSRVGEKSTKTYTKAMFNELLRSEKSQI
jgi:hypothetical protein